jgi:hypothetical protein
VGKELRDVLPYFDGSPLDVVQQAIKTEKKMVLSEGLIRKLIDYDIVGPATETAR